jgi:hypothetical protein
MIHLDHRLVASARSLIMGANIDHATELIFAYEQAVSLHNHGAAGHVIYQEIHEDELRNFVTIEGGRRAQAAIRLWEGISRLHERSQAVMRRARDAITNAERVQERSRELNIRVDEALQSARTSLESTSEEPQKS